MVRYQCVAASLGESRFFGTVATGEGESEQPHGPRRIGIEFVGTLQYLYGVRSFPKAGVQVTIAGQHHRVVRQQADRLLAHRPCRPVLHLGVSEGFTYDLSKTIVGG